MIKIYLLDFTGAEAEDFSASALPKFISETRNPALRRERFFSYLLLSHAYLEIFEHDMPGIRKNSDGKAFFVGENTEFNISHSENVAAVIISDEGRVGIDVQRVIDRVSAGLKAKVEKEKTDLDFSHAEEPICLKCSHGKLVGAEMLPISEKENMTFFRKWTRREALAKADGRGLSLISEIDPQDFTVLFDRYVFTASGVYSVTAIRERA